MNREATRRCWRARADATASFMPRSPAGVSMPPTTGIHPLLPRLPANDKGEGSIRLRSIQIAIAMLSTCARAGGGTIRTMEAAKFAMTTKDVPRLTRGQPFRSSFSPVAHASAGCLPDQDIRVGPGDVFCRTSHTSELPCVAARQWSIKKRRGHIGRRSTLDGLRQSRTLLIVQP